MSSIINLYLPFGVAINILIFIILMIMGWKAWKTPDIVRKKNFGWFILLIAIVSIFSYIGDFYHYYHIFIDSRAGRGYLSHIETIYEYTFQLSLDEYYIWRIIVWGVSIALVTATARKLRLNPWLIWFVYLSYGLIFFINGRVTLAMSIMFYGLAILTHNKGRFYKRIIGLLLIGCSFYFHKSAGFGIGVIILSLICRKINKYTIGLCIVLVPVFIILCQTVLADVLSMTNDGEGHSPLTSAQGYLSREEAERGIGRMIQKYLLWVDFALWFWIIVKAVKNRIYKSWPLDIRVYVNFSFFALLISSIFFFDLGHSTKILQLRFAEFAFFPVAVMITACRMQHFSDKLTKWAVRIGFIQTGYNLIYILYIAIINPIPQ